MLTAFSVLRLPLGNKILPFCIQSVPGYTPNNTVRAGLTEQELVGRAWAELPEYVQSGGYDDMNGITVSPYYTAKVSGTEIPVYASVVFIRVDDTGTLHSFSEIYVDADEEFSFNIEITGADVELKNAVVLPESHGVKALCENNTVTASINKTGIYTFLFNDANQYYGYTLFVREKVDEDKEIANISWSV